MDGSASDAKICFEKAVDVAVIVVVVVVVVVVVLLAVEGNVAGAIKITHARQFSIT